MKKIKKIAFVEPINEKLNIYSKFKLPRLGCTILATIMEESGYKSRAFFLTKDEIYKKNFEEKFDAIGISTITATANTAYELGKYFKSKGLTVIMGGPHVTFDVENALKYSDFVIKGEGEIPIQKLIKAINSNQSYKEIKGLAWIDDKNQIHNNDVDNPIQNLDLVPIPNFSLLDTGKTKLGSGGLRRTIPVQTSRGCPFSCTFCSVTPMFGKKFRYRSTKSIIEEIKKYDKKKDTIFFVDDNFTSNRKRAKKLLREMIRIGTPRWSTQVRIDIAKDQELLDLMKKARCETVYIGFESVDPEALKEMKKNQTPEEIQYGIREIRKRNIMIHGMFVFGFEADTIEKMQATVDFAIKEKIETAQFLILTPLPGSEFYYEMVDKGRIIDYNWGEYDTHHVKFYPNSSLSVCELQDMQIWAHSKFYSTKNNLLKLLRGKGRLMPFIVGIYAKRINKLWQKWEEDYLIDIKKIDQKFAKKKKDFLKKSVDSSTIVEQIQ